MSQATIEDVEQFIKSLLDNHDTATAYTADCIEDYLHSDWGEEEPPAPFALAENALTDLIEAAQGALAQLRKELGR